MSEELERLALKIANGVGRRGFLGKMAAAAAALTASLFGFAQKTEALVQACSCCALCLEPSVSCSGRCSWSWFCRASSTHMARCYEFYSDATCNGSCRGVSCSSCTLRPLIGLPH